MTNHYQELVRILERLRTIQQQEDQSHQMDQQLNFSTRDLVDEMQALLQDELEAYESGYQ